MYKHSFILLLIVCVENGNAQAQEEIFPLHTGKEFRFKGLAIDDKTEFAYLGSWDKKEIVKISLTNVKISQLKKQMVNRKIKLKLA